MIYLSCPRWLPGVNSSDASEAGYGVTYRLSTRAYVGRLGRVAERSRYRLGAGAARSHVAATQGLVLTAAGKIVAADPEALLDGGEVVDGPP